jgi:hypothetical protein
MKRPSFDVFEFRRWDHYAVSKCRVGADHSVTQHHIPSERWPQLHRCERLTIETVHSTNLFTWQCSITLGLYLIGCKLSRACRWGESTPTTVIVICVVRFIFCVVRFVFCVVRLLFVLFGCYLCCSVCFLCCSVVFCVDRLFVLFGCYLCCSMYCLCVNVYCHRVTTQLQLINISHNAKVCYCGCQLSLASRNFASVIFIATWETNMKSIAKKTRHFCIF